MQWYVLGIKDQFMRILCLALGLASFSLFAQESVSFINDREGTSFYSGNSSRRSIEDVRRDFSDGEMLEAYKAALAGTPKLCAYDVNSKTRSKLFQLNRRFQNYEGVVYFLREQNEIDDVVAGILLRAHKVVTTQVVLKPNDQVSAAGPTALTKKTFDAKKLAEFNQKTIELILAFDKRLEKGGCLDQAYLGLLSDIRRDDKKFEAKNLEGYLYSLREKKLISEALFVKLEQAIINELETGGLSLSSYAQKLKVLRSQFPLRDRTERSNFVAMKANKVKMSYRQRLFENYNEVQIALMADMIKQLRRRLEATAIEILIHNKDQTVESIPLEPMERFRFSIKKLRSEMVRLSLSSQFSGRSPDYMDLITASYEVSFIAGSELEQLAGLEDIWNPKKSFWEKAQVWLRAFSGVASVVIPPPYGFIPTLILVVIEATVNKEDPNPEDHGSLF